MAAKTVIYSGPSGLVFPALRCLRSLVLPADNVWRIITYLRSLNTNNAAADEAVPGNPAMGQETFWGKGGCAGCHEVNARGMDIGPDLSDAGKNSAAYLRSVIMNPNASKPNAPRWFGPSGVRVKTREGEEVVGIKRAEDDYTLMMTDLTGKLRRFDRKDILAEQAQAKSLMPDNYSQLLSPTEIQDLVAYLKSLKSRDLSKTIQVDLPGGLSFPGCATPRRSHRTGLPIGAIIRDITFLRWAKSLQSMSGDCRRNGLCRCRQARRSRPRLWLWTAPCTPPTPPPGRRECMPSTPGAAW